VREINAYKILLGKPEGRRPCGRARYRQENNVRIDLGEIEREGVAWMHLTQSRDQWWAFVNTVMNVQVP
jgi:hypothetical protein